MFKINRKIEYALIALRHMSAKSPGILTSAKEICDIYQTPFDPTSRGLQIMSQHGILQAAQGAHGGYQIIKDLSKVTMLELTEMITGPIEIVNCFHDDYSHCDITASCNVISPMLNLNSKIGEFFASISVKELIESRHSAEEEIIKSKPAKG